MSRLIRGGKSLVINEGKILPSGYLEVFGNLRSLMMVKEPSFSILASSSQP